MITKKRKHMIAKQKKSKEFIFMVILLAKKNITQAIKMDFHPNITLFSFAKITITAPAINKIIAIIVNIII